MFTKMFLVAVLSVVLTGCAMKFQKPISEPAQPAYEAPQKTSQAEMQSENNNAEEQPAQKASVGKLSAKQIQTALKNAGFYTGAIDGKIGHKTKSAIKKFQTANNLKADGVVGKKTAAALNQYLTE